LIHHGRTLCHRRCIIGPERIGYKATCRIEEAPWKRRHILRRTVKPSTFGRKAM
jgi:hypothetical protein